MKKKYLLIILLLSVFTTNLTYAYPPDNAAVLYYKNMEHFAKPDEALWDQIADLPTSSEPASEEAKAFIEKQKKNHLIPELQTASELDHCDWGLDFSQGFDLLMPGLAHMKDFSRLILADSAVAASEGNTATALEKNLAVRRMAQHTYRGETLISYLVSFVMTKESNRALEHILATYSIELTDLMNLKRELLLESYSPASIRDPLSGERNVAVLEFGRMTPERLKSFFYGGLLEDPSENKKKKSLLEKKLELKGPAYTDFINGSIEYLDKYYDTLFTLLDKPYPQAFNSINQELEKVTDDVNAGNTDAILTATFVPAVSRCYNYTALWKTEHNALLTALDIYVISQKTGKLPQKLPNNSYIDAFSGKPFIYEITKDGFTLKCQQEDLVKKTTHEFSYKLPK